MKTCREIIDAGNCKGNCCGIIPFSVKFWQKNKELTQTLILAEIKSLENYIIPVTEDLKCPFLMEKDYLCVVYERRPDVCKKFGNGDPHPLLQCPYSEKPQKEEK